MYSKNEHRQTPTDDFLEPDDVFFVCFVYSKKGSETKKRMKEEEIEKRLQTESPKRCSKILSDFMRFDPHYPLMSNSADSNHQGDIESLLALFGTAAVTGSSYAMHFFLFRTLPMSSREFYTIQSDFTDTSWHWPEKNDQKTWGLAVFTNQSEAPEAKHIHTSFSIFSCSFRFKRSCFFLCFFSRFSSSRRSCTHTKKDHSS